MTPDTCWIHRKGISGNRGENTPKHDNSEHVLLYWWPDSWHSMGEGRASLKKVIQGARHLLRAWHTGSWVSPLPCVCSCKTVCKQGGGLLGGGSALWYRGTGSRRTFTPYLYPSNVTPTETWEGLLKQKPQTETETSNWDRNLKQKPQTETETSNWDRNLKQKPQTQTETSNSDRNLKLRQKPQTETETSNSDRNLEQKPQTQTETSNWDRNLKLRQKPQTETSNSDRNLKLRQKPRTETSNSYRNLKLIQKPQTETETSNSNRNLKLRQKPETGIPGVFTDISLRKFQNSKRNIYNHLLSSGEECNIHTAYHILIIVSVFPDFQSGWQPCITQSGGIHIPETCHWTCTSDYRYIHVECYTFVISCCLFVILMSGH